MVDIEREMLKHMYDIPFENSHAQTDSVIDGSLTPERAYRNLGLRFLSRWHDLKACSIKRRMAANKVKQLERKLTEAPVDPVATLSDLEMEDIQLQIEEIRSGWDYEDKLAHDCKAELMHIMKRMHQLPCYDRESFEKSEAGWLSMKHNQVQYQPVVESMESGKFLESTTLPKFQIAMEEVKALLDDTFSEATAQ